MSDTTKWLLSESSKALKDYKNNNDSISRRNKLIELSGRFNQRLKEIKSELEMET